MKKLLAALLLVASTALGQSNGWQEIQNGWGEIQTALGSYATMPAPAGCTATSVPIFLGSPVAMGCDAGLTYDAATGTLTVGAISSGGTIAGASVSTGYLTNIQRISTTGAGTFFFADSGGGSNVYVTPGSANFQTGAANNATPVAQMMSVQSGSGTNIAGQTWTRKGSLGTGSANSGGIKEQTGYPTTSGTTAHTPSDRSALSPKWTALTAGAATGCATLTYGASTSIGAEFFVTIRAGDGTNRQGMSYRVAVNSVRNAAGNTQSVVAVIGTPPVAAGSGTLTCTFDVAEGAGAATLRANCASSLTETFLDANFQVIANGPGLTIAAL